MKRLCIVMLIFLLLAGCGKSEKVPVEYTWAELKELTEKVTDAYLEEYEKLNDVEINGTSEDENEQYEHYKKVSEEIYDKVFEDMEIEQGQEVIVSGYIDDIYEMKDEDKKSVCGSVVFAIMNEKEGGYGMLDGILCYSNDMSFLEFSPRTPIKIKGVLYKKGTAFSGWDLFDCEIME